MRHAFCEVIEEWPAVESVRSPRSHRNSELRAGVKGVQASSKTTIAVHTAAGLCCEPAAAMHCHGKLACPSCAMITACAVQPTPVQTRRSGFMRPGCPLLSLRCQVHLAVFVLLCLLCAASAHAGGSTDLEPVPATRTIDRNFDFNDVVPVVMEFDPPAQQLHGQHRELQLESVSCDNPPCNTPTGTPSAAASSSPTVSPSKTASTSASPVSPSRPTVTHHHDAHQPGPLGRRM